MNSPALMTFNLQFVIKKLSKALQKNYLYNQDKYRYAKSMTSSYLSWSFSENIISHAYLFYNKPFKMKRSLKRISVFLRKHQKYCHFLLTTLHTTSIILVSTTIYLICLKLYEKFKRIDEIIVLILLFKFS